MVSSYKYTACGLDDVIIEGLEPEIDDAGEKTYRLPQAIGLHRVIAHSLIVRSHGLNPKELRYLRTEMGLTQAELAVIVKKDHQTIGRWERGETPIDPNAELVIRMLAADRFKLDPNMSVEEMAKRCVPSAEFKEIVIESANDGYHLKAA
jgi:transcriptional regulator with XRE-family HTH domain